MFFAKVFYWIQNVEKFFIITSNIIFSKSFRHEELLKKGLRSFPKISRLIFYRQDLSKSFLYTKQLFSNVSIEVSC